MSRPKGPFALRIFVIALGMVMIGLAIWSHMANSDPFSVVLLVAYALVLIVGTAFERWRYRPIVQQDDPAWKPTDEVFLDPVTGVRVRVWFNPHSGERDYRPEGS